jgi:F-type H+-transporting ATPase subunit delta
MRGASRESRSAGRERLERLIAAGPTDVTALAEDLFGVADMLASSTALRRALTDPSRSGEAKTGLLRRLIGGRVSGSTLELVSGCVRARWSNPGDLLEVVDALGVNALLAAAESAGRLDTVEDELFRFSRVVTGDDGLRDAFSGRTEGAARKEVLVRRLLEGKAAPETVRLAVRAARSPHGLRTEQVLEWQVRLAAGRRHELVAGVVTAAPLTVRQSERLMTALRQLYGRPIRLAVDLDPDVVGGMRVRVGGDVVEGTLSSRIEQARRRLAG